MIAFISFLPFHVCPQFLFPFPLPLKFMTAIIIIAYAYIFIYTQTQYTHVCPESLIFKLISNLFSWLEAFYDILDSRRYETNHKRVSKN